MSKLSAARLKVKNDSLVDEFNASIHFDKRLYRHDIRGSIAHAEMLASCGILTAEEAEAIKDGLLAVLGEIESGGFVFRTEDEDIHMAVEKRMTEIVGSVGGKLHTARSRNDQVAVDVRMYLREETEVIAGYMAELVKTLTDKAEKHLGVLMPGYTHLQTAQPVLVSHWLMAYVQMFRRDYGRMTDCAERMNFSPLGSGALAGTTFPVNRDMTAEKLGFTAPTENSMDSVSDRDFALEFLSAAAICQMHLSRFSEELIIFSTSEFAFIDLSDDFCTGSSIMPQKKNPDMPELIRGKTGRMYGNLVSLLTTMKGLPLAYNKDMQEDKEPLFDSVDTIKASLRIFIPMIEKMGINAEKMTKAAKLGFSTATDLADYLVRKGMPFREAHHIVGSAVAFALDKRVDISELTIDELKSFSEKIDDDIYSYITPEASVSSRKAKGGTAGESVKAQIESARKFLDEVL
ncbi:argininosuccinate lyase [Geovibrio thiophilus]|uniref:Argininosuccinate lyase n=2 Tax=Geovibrio thiophilus TaxID=139438 RepID=A0A410JUU1_9BACT|nr:argininosuccinate lyase [Geovibrio thiophilus]QAR31943.1 argininosuccinate lyase [Geovibrio thiophilus]